MRLNIYKSPTEWESYQITKEDWPEIKEYLEKNNIWYTLCLSDYNDQH